MQPQLLSFFVGCALAAPHLGPRDDGCGAIVSSAVPITITVVSPVQTVTVSTYTETSSSDTSHTAIPTGSPGSSPASAPGISEVPHGASPWSNNTALPKETFTVTLGLSTPSAILPTASATPRVPQSGVGEQPAPSSPSASINSGSFNTNAASSAPQGSENHAQSSSPLEKASTEVGGVAPTTTTTVIPTALTSQSGSAPLETASSLSTITGNASVNAPSQTSQSVQSQTPVQVSASTGSQAASSLSVTKMFLVFILLAIEGFFIC
ncbi:hypothetical protein JMJ77_0012165 [Colletotrichum scovillei]|uniref:Uncharacterized protein n=1 Tax=Colletotrichum scovillei TaxID=1209932 RepID=A0A9P7QRG9_9PEZI|nr:hypothetical protein JMJ78_0001217 [Colletotrichum scovillei]KAG7041645.1 hypothetical protein JMJ77_0012165 [Colletotrichum scovillei]KAG7061671.1 hypothetical protein JMJ76_0003631 [Colletotrichum scovillei]